MFCREQKAREQIKCADMAESWEGVLFRLAEEMAFRQKLEQREDIPGQKRPGSKDQGLKGL